MSHRFYLYARRPERVHPPGPDESELTDTVEYSLTPPTLFACVDDLSQDEADTLVKALEELHPAPSDESPDWEFKAVREPQPKEDSTAYLRMRHECRDRVTTGWVNKLSSVAENLAHDIVAIRRRAPTQAKSPSLVSKWAIHSPDDRCWPQGDAVALGKLLKTAARKAEERASGPTGPKSVTGAGSKTQPDPPATTEPEEDKPLSEREKTALQALYEKEAFDSDHRVKTAEVAMAAIGPNADGNSFKHVITSLKKRHYVNTHRARGGGCWLTELGKGRAKNL